MYINILGQVSLKESVKLRPLDLTTSETETELPEVDLDVSVKKPLLSNDDVNNRYMCTCTCTSTCIL